MKKITILLSFFALFQIQAQSNRFGTISGNVGANVGINVVALEKTGVTAYPLDGGSAIMTHFPIDLNVGLLKPISIGVNYSPSRWIVGGISGKFSSVGLNINLFPVNKNRFNMQLALTPSLLNFQTFSFAYDQNNKIDIKLNGTSFKTRLIFNFYFSDYAGMYFDLGYSSYKIGIENYNVLIQDPALESEINNLLKQDYNLRLPGAQVGIGFVVKLFNGFSKKVKTEG